MFQHFFSLVVVSVLILTACGGGQMAALESPATVEQVKPAAATESVQDASANAVAFYYEENAQFELISPQGARVLIDIANPKQLTAPPTAADILLTTHSHQDHYNANFVKSFPGQQLDRKEGALEVADVKIKGIKSAHNGDEPDGGDYIFVVEMGGLRIGHFGDCGQQKLTQEQLDQLGQLDVMITQLQNSYSSVSLTNKKAFNLIDQLKPKLVIPTHGNGDAKVIKYAIDQWQKAYVGASKVAISPDRLPDTTQFLILGDIMAAAYKKLYNLPEW